MKNHLILQKKLFYEGKIYYLAGRDYSENSEIDKLIKQFFSLKK
jgi:hypothetical protein